MAVLIDDEGISDSIKDAFGTNPNVALLSHITGITADTRLPGNFFRYSFLQFFPTYDPKDQQRISDEFFVPPSPGTALPPLNTAQQAAITSILRNDSFSNTDFSVGPTFAVKELGSEWNSARVEFCGAADMLVA